MSKIAAFLSLYWYTSSESYRDLNWSQRNNNFKRWKYFDNILDSAINSLSQVETGDYPLYTGFSGIKCNISSMTGVRFISYCSSSISKKVALTFLNGDGMLLIMDPKMRNDPNHKCCDVSWISDYSEELEVLFGRGKGRENYWFEDNPRIFKDTWDCQVEMKNKIQIVRISPHHKL